MSLVVTEVVKGSVGWINVITGIRIDNWTDVLNYTHNCGIQVYIITKIEIRRRLHA